MTTAALTVLPEAGANGTCACLHIPPPLSDRALQRQQRGKRRAVAAALIADLSDAVAAEAHLGEPAGRGALP